MAAVRPGIAYTGDGRVECALPAGRYTVWASKGFEWGVDRAVVDLAVDDAPPVVALEVGPEVDTRGFVCADTHIHTLTHSGHGDSSVEERMVTLAAEGVEVAIATDHNHNTDYRSTQKAMKLTSSFLAVTGNEVTTPVGHMNAFPLDPSEAPPNHRLKDWVKLVDGIRDAGAQVVILNHPRWPQIPTGPFGRFGLDRVTGDLPGPRRSGDAKDDAAVRQLVVPFDGMELINTTTLQRDPMYLVTDWFALLNRGVRIGAVGSSDSHTVGDPVGQGRTYVPSRTDEPSKVDIDEICRGFRELRTTVSMGIYCDLEVDRDPRRPDRAARVGATVEPGVDGEIALSLRVASPSWTSPRRAVVFVNGREVEAREIELPVGDDGQRLPLDTTLEFTVRPSTGHDSWIVCAVFGDGIRAPFWPTLNDYTFAATNPIWVEADGVRGWSSPRATAEKMVAKAMSLGKLAPTRLADLVMGASGDKTVQMQVLAAVRDVLVERGAVDMDALRAALAPYADLIGGDDGKAWVAGIRAH